MTFTPTPEQEEIISASRDPRLSVMVQAYAGTAKTTSIQLAAPQIRVPALALAFNKAIATELKDRLPENWTVKTLNGLGHLAWMRALPANISLKLDDRKLGKLVTSTARDSRVDLSSEQWDQTRSLVTKAMQAGLSPDDLGDPLVSDSPETWADLAEDAFIPAEDQPLLISLARTCLIDSIRLAKQGIISFDDQIYCPTILGGQWPRYPALAGDETQDWSPLNHRMIRLASRPDAKLLLVGDPKQAIYGWRGADAASMTNLRGLRSDWLDRKLTLTFRCPKVVVSRQQQHAPGFRAANQAPEGLFQQLLSRSSDPSTSLGGWGYQQIRRLGPGTLAVLCRNNAPLLSLAFKLLREGVGVQMAGRDLGKGLLALSRQIAAADNLPASHVFGAIEEWEISQRSLALANHREEKLAGISDRAESLRAILEGSSSATAGDLRAAIRHIFETRGSEVLLSTIHRAKGLEWDIVLHLDPWRVPSRQARAAARRGDERPLQQEYNLIYVAETRTKGVLVEANLEDFSSSSTN